MVTIMVKCDYGCGEPAIKTLKNGKKLCSEKTTQCSAVRKRNSEGLKKAKTTYVICEFCNEKISNRHIKHHRKI